MPDSVPVEHDSSLPDPDNLDPVAGPVGYGKPSILNYAGAFLTGGLHGVAKQAGVETPAWSDRVAAVLQNPDVNLALGMTAPLPMDQASRLARANSMGFWTTMPIKFGTAPEGEKIASAAMKLNGKIFTGVNHADAITKAEDALGIPFEQMKQAPIMDGFITTAGRFVSRREAADIAQREMQGQSGGVFGATRGLASEDVARTGADVSPPSGVRTGATVQGLPGGHGVWGVLMAPGQSASSALWHRAELPGLLEAAGLSDYEIQASLRNAWDAGHDSVLMKNYIRPGARKPESIVVVRDLNQLRSPRAASDPAKMLSPNILAGFGGVAAVPAAAQLIPVEHDPFE